jgi:hypothetical protein
VVLGHAVFLLSCGGCVVSLTSRLHLEGDWFRSHVLVLLRLVREGIVRDWLEAVLTASWERPLSGGLGHAIKSGTLRGRGWQQHVSNISFASHSTTPERPLLEMSARESPMGANPSLITQVSPEADVRSFARQSSLLILALSFLFLVFTCLGWKV